MLKQEDKDKLKSLGFDVAVLETAIKSETETEITIPVGSFMDDASLTARDTNKIAEGKTLGIAEGKTAGFEIANKAIIEKFSRSTKIGTCNGDEYASCTKKQC